MNKKSKKILGPGYELSLPSKLGGEMVMAISMFKDYCTECNSEEICNHLEVDYHLNGLPLHMCSCRHCGFIWYCREKEENELN